MSKARYLQCAQCCSDFTYVQFWLFTYNNLLDGNPMSNKGLVGWLILSVEFIFQKESKPNFSSLSQAGILLYRYNIYYCMIIRRVIISSSMLLQEDETQDVYTGSSHCEHEILNLSFSRKRPTFMGHTCQSFNLSSNRKSILGGGLVFYFISENRISLLPFLTLEGNDFPTLSQRPYKLF